jgi:hypothetical protein
MRGGRNSVVVGCSRFTEAQRRFEQREVATAAPAKHASVLLFDRTEDRG